MSANLPHILVVDDDDRLRELLRRYLQDNGFVVAIASDAQDARAKLMSLAFDLIVLDVMMPGENGLDLAAELSRRGVAPLLMLTAMAEPQDRIDGLERGVDDYLTKPFEPRELVLRINSILRRVRQPEAAPAEIRLGEVMFDARRGELRRGAKTIRLTSIEVALLTALAARPGEILSREDLFQYAGTGAGGRAVDVQVTRLRRKIEPDPKLPRYLQTVRGRGYVLRPD